MVKTGSFLNFTRQLRRADNIFLEFSESISGINYAKALTSASSVLGKALKEKGFDNLLILEKIADQRDFRIFGTEQAQSSESAHKTIIERWEIGCDPERARADFISSYAPENLSKAKVMDPIMKSLINTQCRRLSEYAKGNIIPAEKLYFNRRSECLKAIYKQHILHIEHALGLFHTPEKAKNLER